MIKTITILLLVGFQFAGIGVLHAQKNDLSLEIVGQPSLSGVSHILQDHFGFIWFGTGSGLFKFDGYNVVTYRHDPSDSFSISNNSITAIAEDNAQNLWVGTIDGLNKLNMATGKCVRYQHNPEQPHSLSHNYITSLAFDRSGTLWVGTQQGGLNEAINLDPRHPDSLSFYRHQHTPNDSTSLSSNHIRFVLDDTLNEKRMLWIGTANGLNAFDKSTRKFVRYFYKPDNANSLCTNDLYSAYQDKAGDLWIGASEGCLSQLTIVSGGEIRFRHHKLGANQKVYGIIGDEDDNLWLSTRYHGLYRFNRNTHQIAYYDEKALHLKNVSRFAPSTAFIDHAGALWIATWPFLYKNDPHRQRFAYVPLDPPPNIWSMGISAFWADHAGSLWIGTYGSGLLKYDSAGGQVSHFAPDSSQKRYLSSRWVQSILEDRSGAIWVGTFHGLNRYDPRRDRFENYYWDPGKRDNPKNLISNYIYCLYEDRQGDVWIGSARGLSRFDHLTGKFAHYLNDSDNQIAMTGHYIGAIHEDRKGTMWVGANGIYQFDRRLGELAPFYYETESGPRWIDQMVFAIREDRSGNLWIATFEGLFRIDVEQKVTHFTERDGLPSNHVYGIVEDNEGFLWISTFKGLVKYDPRSATFRRHDLKEGFLRNELGYAYRDKDGRCYLAQANGFTMFHPEDIKDNPYVPPVRITGMKVFDQPVTFAKPIAKLDDIRLSYSQNMFAFDFVALNYTDSYKNQYAFKMEGFHDDWIYCGNRRTATFTNLDPGKYLFRVKGSNNDGVWNEDGASIRVIITPPWWRTVWAYASYAFLFIASVFGVIRFEVDRHKRKVEVRLREERERRRLETAEHRAIVAELQARAAEAEKEIEKEQMRSRIAGDLHDEIGSNLSTIAIVSQIAADKLKAGDSEKRRLQEIPRLARQTAESMRDIIWFINPENDSMDKLVVKMRQTANLMLEHIDFSFNAPATEISFAADVNFRRNLYLIYKECLQNIIKHAQATKVEIAITMSGSCFQLRVSDNGIGFDAAREFAGNGLKNFQWRAAEMGGTIEISSDRSSGTTVRLVIKIP